MRAVKAEGGWAVVCTEQAEIHYSSEITPFMERRGSGTSEDIPTLARLTEERVHHFGALAGIELAYNGMNGSNLTRRVRRPMRAGPPAGGHVHGRSRCKPGR